MELLSNKKLTVLILMISLVLIFSTGIQVAAVGGGEFKAAATAKYCKYVGRCDTQAKCAAMCDVAGFSPSSVYCDQRVVPGPQCCCIIQP